MKDLTGREYQTKLLNNVIRVFATVAREDNQLSFEEKCFVKDYLQCIYPENIAVFLYGKFEEYCQEESGIAAEIKEISAETSYEEKIFLLIKLFELISSDSIKDAEFKLARRVASLLGINNIDQKVIEGLFASGSFTYYDTYDSEVKPLTVGQDKDGDLYFPDKKINVTLLKISNSFYILNRSQGKDTVFLNNYSVKKGILTKVQHNDIIMLGDYQLNYDDIVFYFNIKYTPLKVRECTLFISLNEQELWIETEKNENSSLVIELQDLLIRVKKTSDDTTVKINQQELLDEAYINLNDFFQINGIPFNLKKVVFESLIEEITLSVETNKYTISNNPAADIFIKDELDDNWYCNLLYQGDRLLLDKQDCPYLILVNGEMAKENYYLKHHDLLSIEDINLRIDLKNKKIVKAFFSFKDFMADEISYQFSDGTKGVDRVSFKAEFGEMVCIMGPSGSGKSTLLNIMNGNYTPTEGQIRLDSFELQANFKRLKSYFGYIPQDDLLFDNLTVYENLYYNARLRYPEWKKEEIDALVSDVLQDIDLEKKKGSIVGSPLKKVLSGGERKRLNIGIELLSDAKIYYIDEPTSGLSSKDSEKIIDVLKRISLQGKMVFVIIHQPSSKIYQQFDKVILLDKGGKLAFFGGIDEAIDYFRKNISFANLEEDYSTNPDLLFDALEEPLRNIDGTTMNIRRHTPGEWQEKFQVYSQNTKGFLVKYDNAATLPLAAREKSNRFKQFLTLFNRDFKNKLRNKSNLLITFLAAPLLAFLISYLLYYSPYGEYTFEKNSNLNIFIFVTVIVVLFLGITNSVTDIINDRHIFKREKMLRVRASNYYLSKFLTLLSFGFIQAIIYIIASFNILEFRELYLQYILVLTVLAAVGISIGLFISSLPGISARAAMNLVPIILIPQIILGGALLNYEDMNRNLKYYQNAPIPGIANYMPSRWAYEGLIVLQGDYNKCSRLLRETNELAVRQGESYNNKISKIKDQYAAGYMNADLRQLIEDRRMEYQHYQNKLEKLLAENDQEGLAAYLRKYRQMTAEGIIAVSGDYFLDKSRPVLRAEIEDIRKIEQNLRGNIQQLLVEYKYNSDKPQFDSLELYKEHLFENTDLDQLDYILDKGNQKLKIKLKELRLEQALNDIIMLERIEQLETLLAKMQQFRLIKEYFSANYLFKASKIIPLFNVRVSTVIYNCLVLGLIILLAGTVSLLLIKYGPNINKGIRQVNFFHKLYQ